MLFLLDWNEFHCVPLTSETKPAVLYALSSTHAAFFFIIYFLSDYDSDMFRVFLQTEESWWKQVLDFDSLTLCSD